MIGGVGQRPVTPDKAADLPGKQGGKSHQKQSASPFGGGDGTYQKPRYRNCDQHQQRDAGGIDTGLEAADQRYLAARLLDPPMQLCDEGAVVMVLRRHQRHPLPPCREDDDSPPIRLFSLPPKPPRPPPTPP